LAAVCLAQMLLMLDVTIVIVALPDIAADLSGSLQSMQLIVDAYALALAALLLNTGAIADRVGRRRVFIAGLVTFGLASALCGVASGATFLVTARALQGVGGAMLFATGLAILGAAYVGADRVKALGAFGAVFGAAVALGPVIGGAIIEVADWRWIFLVNLPVVALAVVIALRHVPETRSPRPRRVDWVGQGTFAVGIGSLVGALIKGGDWGWASTRTVAVAATAALTLAAFLVSQARQAEPMFDLALLRNRSFAGSAIAAFATSASLFGMFVYLILYFQKVEGIDGLHAGTRLLPVTILAFVAAAGAGRLSSAVSARLVLTAALGCTAAGLLQMTMLEAASSWTVALPGLALCGLGFGLANPTVAAVTLAVAPPDQAATAIGMNSTFRQVGVATGVAAMGALFDHALSTPDAAGARAAEAASAAYSDALHHVFLAGSAIAAAGAVLAAVLVRAAPTPAPPPRSAEHTVTAAT
jgi:EmrB/QacA subfamily drug resistance transporter